MTYQAVIAKATEEAARKYLRDVLKQTGGNARKAAEIAGINRTDFYRVCRRAGMPIVKPDTGNWHEQGL